MLDSLKLRTCKIIPGTWNWPRHIMFPPIVVFLAIFNALLKSQKFIFTCMNLLYDLVSKYFYTYVYLNSLFKQLISYRPLSSTNRNCDKKRGKGLVCKELFFIIVYYFVWCFMVIKIFGRLNLCSIVLSLSLSLGLIDIIYLDGPSDHKIRQTLNFVYLEIFLFS